MKRKTGSIAMWIASLAYASALAVCLLAMIASSVAISFAGLSRVVGLVIAGAGLLGCTALLLAGGAVIVAAVTVYVMKRKAERENGGTAADGAES